MLDHFIHRRPGVTGWKARGDRFEPLSLDNPFGPLCSSTRLGTLHCDISDVEGISASKSDERFFASVQDFGRDFTKYLGLGVEAASLERMRHHDQSRILHSPPSDGFSWAAWDGRLFLDNAGGSHHFAGASFLAAELKQRIELTGPIYASWLNAGAWRWLTDQYHLFYVQALDFMNQPLARLLGHCFVLPLPHGLGEGSLLLAPRYAPGSARVHQLFAATGHADVTPGILQMLDGQEAQLARLESRLPNLADKLMPVRALVA